VQIIQDPLDFSHAQLVGIHCDANDAQMCQHGVAGGVEPEVSM